jgi:hypothetical protein
MLGLDIAQVDPYEEALEEALDTLVPFVLDGAVNELSADRDNEAGTLSFSSFLNHPCSWIYRACATQPQSHTRDTLFFIRLTREHDHFPQVVGASVCSRLRFPLAN